MSFVTLQLARLYRYAYCSAMTLSTTCGTVIDCFAGWRHSQSQWSHEEEDAVICLSLCNDALRPFGRSFKAEQ